MIYTQTAADTLAALPTPTPPPTDTLLTESVLPVADTTFVEGDSLLMAGFQPADSLVADSPLPDSLAAEPEPEPLYRPVSAREVFGSMSLTVAPKPATYAEPLRPLTGNPAFEALVLLLAAA